MHKEVGQAVVAHDYSVSSMMHDLSSPSTMRVKSGYEGHVPRSRDFIGGSYRTMENRGVPGRDPVRGPISRLPPGIHVPRPEMRSAGQASRSMYHDPFTTGAGDMQHEYGQPTSAPVPARIQKVLSGDRRDVDSSTDWLMVGYTGHAPKAKEVIGTNYFGPPEGPAYHGPAMPSSKYHQPMSYNKVAIAP